VGHLKASGKLLRAGVGCVKHQGHRAIIGGPSHVAPPGWEELRQRLPTRHPAIVVDTGLTLVFLRKLLMQHRPRSLKIAALLDKPSRRIEKIEADYVGFTIPNRFVIGYGMDYAERFRNLPDIRVMPPDFPE